jgi:3-hydroxyisobutyrate dehydrogenase-like beta-hydroxyacid dehydrogenase
LLADEVGTATRMKLIHNMILGTVMASLAEGMALAEKVGLDQEDLHEILCLGSLNCSTVNHKGQGTNIRVLLCVLCVCMHACVRALKKRCEAY